MVKKVSNPHEPEIVNEDIEAEPTEVVNEEQEELLKKIKIRKERMNASRPRIINGGANDEVDLEEVNLDDLIDQFEAKWIPNEDGTANTKLPIARAVVETKVAEEKPRPPRFLIKPLNNQSALRKDAIQRAFDHVQNRDGWNKSIHFSYLISNIYGTSLDIPSVVYHPIVERTGKKDKKGKEIVNTYYETQFVIDSLPLAKVWIDDRAQGNIRRAIDCLIEDEVDYDDFLMKAKAATTQKKGTYFNLEQLKPHPVTKENSQGEPTEIRDSIKNNANMMKRWRYFNRLTDQMVEIIDEKIIVRDGPSPYKKGWLPIVPNISHPDPFSTYGTGDVELLQNTQSEMNTSRDMLYDGMHGWAHPRVFVSGNMAFDEEDVNSSAGNYTRYEGEFDVKQVKVDPPNDSIIGVLNLLNQDVPAFTGVDHRAVLSGPEESARRTQERSELRGKRINNLGEHRGDYLKDIMTLMLDLILKNLPVSDAKRLDGTSGFPQIPVEGVRPNIPEGKNQKQVNGKPQDYIEFLEEKGFVGSFSADPKFLRGQYFVEIDTNSTRSFTEQFEQETISEMVTQLFNISRMADTTLGKQYNMKALADEVIKTFRKNPEDFSLQAETENKMNPLISKAVAEAPRASEPPRPQEDDLRQELINQNVQQ